MSKPFAPGHPTFDALKASADYQDRAREIEAKSGYHPWGVFDDCKDAEKFDFWFAKLPEDLTHVDLCPLYLLAADADQQNQLRRREKSWTPAPGNLGRKYNGPIGEEHEPLPYNLRKWREAVEAKRLAHLNRFEFDLNVMKGADVPQSLRLAAELLVKLAKEADGDRSDVTEWDGCTGGADVPAIAAALRLIERAGGEVRATSQGFAKSIEQQLWEELEDIDAVTKQMQGGGQ